MTDDQRQVWLDFYKAAQIFRDLKPWTWMSDADMFVIQDPETGEMGYCCIMGAAEEVFALGIYYGDRGYYSYLNIIDLPEMVEIDQIAVGLEQQMLKVEFVDRAEMSKQDLAQVKSLGLKFRGRNQWIQAREHLPGYFPWYISEDQARYLTQALLQSVDVAIRFEENSELLLNKAGEMLVRVPVKTDNGYQWSDQYIEEPNPEEMDLLPEASPFLVKRALQELKHQQMAICFSLHYLPGALEKGDGEDRPFFSKIGMWIAYGSEYILGFELFTPKSFAQSFESKFFDQLFSIEAIPQQLIVNSEMAYDAVLPIAEELDMELIFAPELETFDHVFEAMSQFMGGKFER